MLKEYTLKVTVQIGGETEESCEEFLQNVIGIMSTYGCATEITHEEVVGVDEVERE